ncbi:MAG: F0F1 ATP synthase subunit A, partial [Salinivirgaceae bacterium]
MKRIYLLFFSLSISLFALMAQASENQKTNASTDEEFDPTAVIMHHISDAHDWHLWDKVDKETGEKHSVSIPLPVIVWHKGQLDVFMSSAFHHGEQTVIKGSNEYALYHNKIYVAENGELTFDEHHHPTNTQPIDFSITKNVASMMFSALLLLAVFIPMGRKYKKGGKVPSGLQGFMEPIILFIKEDIARPNIGEHKYQRFLPYLITVFFFIWFNNMLGLVPFFPGGANLTGNIAVTFTLAAMTMIITNVSGSKTYWKHILVPPVPKWLWFIMIPVELIGVISKPFALMVRLFANITAGHIIVLSLIFLIFIFKSAWMGFVSVPMVLFMDLLELMVAILQAYIFTL